MRRSPELLLYSDFFVYGFKLCSRRLAGACIEMEVCAFFNFFFRFVIFLGNPLDVRCIRQQRMVFTIAIILTKFHTFFIISDLNNDINLQGLLINVYKKKRQGFQFVFFFGKL